jgi:excisionase family DNA binding protein
MSEPDFPVVTPDEAAAVMGVTPRTVRRRCERGELDAQKKGRQWLIRREEIEDHSRRAVPAA